jgi:hypothetical protein
VPGWAQPGDGNAGAGVNERVSAVAPLDTKGAAAELAGLDRFDVFAGHAALLAARYRTARCLSALVPDSEVFVAICKQSQPDSKCRKPVSLLNP